MPFTTMYMGEFNIRCAICDREDEAVTHSNKDCRVCQAIIYDTIAGYDTETDLDILEESYDDNVEYR